MCNVPAAQRGFVDGQSAMVMGAARKYSLSAPKTKDTRGLSIIFVLHGDGGTGASARAGENYEVAHAEDAVFVYPDGKGNTWNLDTWDASKNEDVLFVDALIAALKTTYCADKVYATGFSRGGFFANHLGCHRANVIRAVASHGGGGPYDGTAKNFDINGNLTCPTRGAAALITIGEGDGLLNDSKFSRKHWTWINGCQSTTAPVTPSPCVTQQGCMQALTWCQIPGLGHSLWPQALEATWAFFQTNK
jgi:polyhydroxybutyrate depolymerase